jgi:hypothetical protein
MPAAITRLCDILNGPLSFSYMDGGNRDNQRKINRRLLSYCAALAIVDRLRLMFFFVIPIASSRFARPPSVIPELLDLEGGHFKSGADGAERSGRRNETVCITASCSKCISSEITIQNSSRMKYQYKPDNMCSGRILMTIPPNVIGSRWLHFLRLETLDSIKLVIYVARLLHTHFSCSIPSTVSTICYHEFRTTSSIPATSVLTSPPAYL